MGSEDWLDEGLALLAEQGAPAVTLDRMCERMGMSKGAFYHHFGSMPKFRTRLLAHYEERHTAAIIERVESAGDISPRAKLGRLAAVAVDGTGADLGVAMRAWAKQDPEAAAMQERVDAARIAYLRELCAGIGYPAPERMATLIYLVVIGGAHVMPPLQGEEMRDLYQLLFPLLDGREATS
ncbi:TetR/AcrR family transcriptional regulator [Actinomadura decatromicini]|uniref:TetR/AcrR family transcriptional regulator n=1 Tax=Actinomadura decatromicini TaxID=2604572 RepID=A0A5D3FDS7_9ACTN|nr:TetR/AcrR family transcriptional regulator [Actinomadura decatromicini]TYK46269.1 TetR/AcrR family transcriptional regulator [Actinomadura decatromicini]